MDEYNSISDLKLEYRKEDCKKKARPRPRMFCEPEPRKVEAICSKIEPLPLCASDRLTYTPSNKLLGPVTLMHYSSDYPVPDRAALVHSAMKRRRGKLHSIMRTNENLDNIEQENIDDHLWYTSDLDILKKEDPVVTKTKRALSDLGRDFMMGTKLRQLLKEALEDWRLAKEICITLKEDPNLRALFDVNNLNKNFTLHQKIIKELLENDDLMNIAIKSLEAQKLVKYMEDDIRMAKKLYKCTELRNIFNESNEDPFLKKSILEMSSKKQAEIKNKVKFSPMSPWVDLPHWFALLTHAKEGNPPKHIQPFLLIDWSMEQKTQAMYRFHQEYISKADKKMLHDFVREISFLVIAEDSADVNETLKEATKDYDFDSALQVLDEAIAHRESILNEIEAMKNYLKKIDDFDAEGLDTHTLYQKQPQPSQLWDFENFFTKTLHPMNAGELLDEVIKPKVPFTPHTSETDGKSEDEESDYLTEHDVEKRQILNKYARLFVSRTALPKKAESSSKIESRPASKTDTRPSSKTETRPKSSEAEVSTPEEISDPLRRPSRIRFANLVTPSTIQTSSMSLEVTSSSKNPKTTQSDADYENVAQKIPSSAKTV